MLSGFSKSAGKWLSCGIEVRLWRRAQFCLGQSDFILADGAWDVCEGDHSLDVMNPWDALTVKIRCRRFGEPRPSLRDRTARPLNPKPGLNGPPPVPRISSMAPVHEAAFVN